MLTVFPGSHQFGTIWPRVRTFAVLQIVNPLSYVFTFIVERERTLAMSLAVLEIAFVRAFVAIFKTGTRTSHLIVFEATYVLRAIRPRVSTGAILFIVLPLTIVCALLPRHFALTWPFVVFPFPGVNASIRERERSLALLDALLPVAFIKTPISPGQFSLSTKLIILEIAFVKATIRECVNAFTVSLVIEPLSIILRTAISFHGVSENTFTGSLVIQEHALVDSAWLPREFTFSLSNFAYPEALVPSAILVVVDSMNRFLLH